MNVEIPEDCKTAATRHPHWSDIRDQLDKRFAHSDALQKWAVEMVSASLMGVRPRYVIARDKLGPDIAGEIITICRGYCIDLEAVA